MEKSQLFEMQDLQRQAKENELKGLNIPKVPPPVPPRPHEWDQAKTWFLHGVDEGLRTVDQKLSGLAWLKIKVKYQGYVNK
jgi:hypothetical protein